MKTRPDLGKTGFRKCLPYQTGDGISVQHKENGVGMSAVLEAGEPQQPGGFVEEILLPAVHHWGISGGLLGWAGLTFLGCKQGVDRMVF